MMFIANELERMGDYAEGIAKVSINMGHEAPLKELEDIPKMADLAVSMMKRSIEAMTSSDRDESAKIAIAIENDDDKVDPSLRQGASRHIVIGGGRQISGGTRDVFALGSAQS